MNVEHLQAAAIYEADVGEVSLEVALAPLTNRSAFCVEAVHLRALKGNHERSQHVSGNLKGCSLGLSLEALRWPIVLDAVRTVPHDVKTSKFRVVTVTRRKHIIPGKLKPLHESSDDLMPTYDSCGSYLFWLLLSFDIVLIMPFEGAVVSVGCRQGNNRAFGNIHTHTHRGSFLPARCSWIPHAVNSKVSDQFTVDPDTGRTHMERSWAVRWVCHTTMQRYPHCAMPVSGYQVGMCCVLA
eukprot:1736320-Amphidinium_carterae.1